MLPFETLQEAEVSLGRNLTFAETLWFNYSANKSDFFLYCHNTIFLFIFYTVLPLPYVIIELPRSRKIDSFKVQPKINNSLSDMLDCYKKIVVYFLLEDYANYWLHRMLHNGWGYYKVHKVHHEYTASIGFAAPYAHWAEIIILGLASFVGPAIVPEHMVTFWLWFIIRQMEAIETHSGYDLPWSPSKYIPFYGGAAYHDYHHYVGQKNHNNFASVFTYCDTLYGTNKGYRYHKEIFKKTREKLKQT